MPQTPQPTKKILIIEDDTFLHELCKKKFIHAGYEVMSAFAGQEGLKKIQKETPALILLDLLLPEMDGLDLLEQLKSDPATAQIPVIIMSNYSDRERVQKGIELGAKDYIIKAHFTPEDIVKKVKDVLEVKI